MVNSTNFYHNLVFSSDGWDRASQLSALVQLIVDPFYRTIEGFELLIEKEFCSFGHRFLDRCGSHVARKNEDEQAPIFIQFLVLLHSSHPRIFTSILFPLRRIEALCNLVIYDYILL